MAVITSANEMDVSAVNNAADQIAGLKGIAQANSAFNADQATLQREWQVQQNAKAMQFNAQEAAKNRAWQEMMSNTAHQREVRDLLAAGLNPVLSATGGNGAAVTSGATASGVTSAGAAGSADTSASGAVANLLGSMLAAQTQLQMQTINARTQEAVADKYTAMQQIIAQIGFEQSKYAVDRTNARSNYEFGKTVLEDLSNSKFAPYISSAFDMAKSTINKVSSSKAVSDVKKAYNNSSLKTYVDKALSYLGLK